MEKQRKHDKSDKLAPTSSEQEKPKLKDYKSNNENEIASSKLEQGIKRKEISDTED